MNVANWMNRLNLRALVSKIGISLSDNTMKEVAGVVEKIFRPDTLEPMPLDRFEDVVVKYLQILQINPTGRDEVLFS